MVMRGVEVRHHGNETSTRHGIPLRRIDTHQIADKEIETLALAKVLAHGVMDARKHNKFEIATRLDEGVDHLHGAGWIDIVIELTHHEHEWAAELMRIMDIAALDIA